MSAQEASETSSFHPSTWDPSTNPGPISLPQPDELKAALDSETDTYDDLLAIVEACKHYISTFVNEVDPALCNAGRVLDCALSQARECKSRQSALRMQLRLLSGHQRLERDTSALRLAVDRNLEARDESSRRESTASARLFDTVGHATRIVMRHVASLCERMIRQGVRIGKWWLKVRGRFV